MKGIRLFLLALTAGLFLASCDKAAKEGGETEGGETAGTETEVAATPEAYAITAEGAEVMWTGSKEEGAHVGSFALTGGSVEVTGDGITGGSATIDVSQMAVLDEGMDEETLSKVRDPFFTTKEVGKGTGLGLSISQKIIDAHDGSLDIQSELGKGSTFTICLPVGGDAGMSDMARELEELEAFTEALESGQLTGEEGDLEYPAEQTV